MPVDPDQARALTFAPITVTVERGRLRSFANAIGQTDPVYVDLDAARQAGHPDLPVPPTFFFSLEMEGPDPWGYLAELGVDLRRVLHGEQSFTYHSMMHAGDTVALRTRIDDVYAKRGGALEFLVRRTDVIRDGDLVAEATSVIVVRNPEVPR
ncbi:MaoC family dehydratase N-terminal domain-containing protein [Micromonospora narathiwatensis]|uniref:N-terminal half of MaoC dehydratase n=1 Tax=Micromonospora narathiwatensis TaxID=299146 RepID=A0A1A9AEK1_9ACTN|nr:MaoC family dehydratase N-terminal domain-containing protein [Micromonospora narathiwatensis]SBT54948.1 N-terminal half of MaoC dehydratase [Micromonospora narathiwatensis]